MPISPLLQRFVDDELNRSADMVQRTVGLTLEQLKQPREGMLNPVERQHYAELVQALQKKRSPSSASFARRCAHWCGPTCAASRAARRSPSVPAAASN